jgi:hypothetical protein
MGASGRPKGCAAEREVAGLLEGWWRQLEPGCRFVRTPSSGGWHGRNGADIRAGFRASGDLMTTAEDFPFVVEVKRREGWSLERFTAGRPSPVWGWWDQACLQAAEQRSEPLLWIRHNREPWRIVMREDLGRSLKLPGMRLTRPSNTAVRVWLAYASSLLGMRPEIVLGATTKARRRSGAKVSGEGVQEA